MVSQGSEVELKSVENNNLVEDTSTTTIYEKARQSKNYFFFTNSFQHQEDFSSLLLDVCCVSWIRQPRPCFQPEGGGVDVVV